MELIGLLLVAALLVIAVLWSRSRRRPGQPFDWTYRRPWWRPRWAFPNNR